jgi:hypothetical protein
MLNSKVFILLGMLVVFASCGNRKKAKLDTPVSALCAETSVLIERLNQQANASWEFVNSKTTVHVETADFDRSVKTSFRFQRDIAMQANISFAGLLVAQARLSNDELLVINRFQKCFIKSDRSALAQFIDFPVEYKQLQNLLMAKPVNHESSNEYVQISNPDFCVLSTIIPRNPEDAIRDTSKITVSYYFDKKSLAINKIKLDSPADGAIIEATYKDFFDEKFNLALPKETSIVITRTGEQGKFTVQFGNPDFEDNTPLVLNIPEKYESCK